MASGTVFYAVPDVFFGGIIHVCTFSLALGWGAFACGSLCRFSRAQTGRYPGPEGFP